MAIKSNPTKGDPGYDDWMMYDDWSRGVYDGVEGQAVEVESVYVGDTAADRAGRPASRTRVPMGVGGPNSPFPSARPILRSIPEPTVIQTGSVPSPKSPPVVAPVRPRTVLPPEVITRAPIREEPTVGVTVAPKGKPAGVSWEDHVAAEVARGAMTPAVGKQVLANVGGAALPSGKQTVPVSGSGGDMSIDWGDLASDIVGGYVKAKYGAPAAPGPIYQTMPVSGPTVTPGTGGYVYAKGEAPGFDMPGFDVIRDDEDFTKGKVYNPRTGKWQRERRRRRKLLTNSDFSCLAQLKTLTGNNDAFKAAVIKAVR